MNFNSPGRVFTATLFIFFITIVRSQHELHDGSEGGKTHLSGIRRLPIRRISDNRPVQILASSQSESTFGESRYYSNPKNSHYPISSQEDEDSQQPQQQQSRWPNWHNHRPQQQQHHHRRLVPFAVAPILSSSSYERSGSREYGYRVNNERRINHRLPAAARGAPTQIYNFPNFHKSESPVSGGTVAEEYKHAVSQKVESNQKRLQRLEARWRKIGPLIGSSSRSPYARMRLVNRLHPIAWTHPPTTTEATTLPTFPEEEEEALPKRVFTTWAPQQPQPTTTEFPWRLPETVEPEIPPSRPILPEVVKATTEAPMIRRQKHKHLHHLESSPVIPSRFKAFGHKSASRFNGPILEETFAPEESESVPQVVPPSRVIERTKSFERFETSEDLPSPSGSLILQDTTKTDYHSRQGGGSGSSSNGHGGGAPAPVKRFKFTNKLSYRPRLKIRKPEEQFAAHRDSNAKSFPLALPELAPIGHSLRQPLPVSNFEPTNAFMARHRASPDQVDIHQAHGLRPLPVPGLGVAEQNIQVEPPQPPPFKKPPSVTDWGDSDDFTPPISEGDEDSGVSGLTGNGSPFGEAGMPPPGFFGHTGEMPTDPTTTPPAPTTTTPRRTTPPPPPEEPFVVPENSGLRPVAPPREFTGGFGSSKGSSLSSFGGGGGGGGGFGGGQPPAPPPPQRPHQPKNPDENFNEEEYFTGDSALMPNRRGPSGDGFGPPVFPGAALPPPVPSVGLGGGAAGIPPTAPPPYNRMINANENEATTVKPSALLSMLNKADEGFNQAITHLQQGTPPEAAFIDILEVALGSQRLDSQAKLLGHVDRTIGIDNLQRLQRWANTGGAFDMVKEQLVKVLKNYRPPPSVKEVTIPPQLEYLFSPTG